MSCRECVVGQVPTVAFWRGIFDVGRGQTRTGRNGTTHQYPAILHASLVPSTRETRELVGGDGVGSSPFGKSGCFGFALS